MDPKAQMLIWELSSSFDNCKVEYQYANELHKFRLEWDPTHWLYFARSFVDDHTEKEIKESLLRWQILEAFRGSQKSRWLFLGESGVREVDDTFGRGHP